MPFLSRPKLVIQITREAETLRFKRSKSNIVSYSPDVDSDGRTPKVVAVQRMRTGDVLDAKAWHLNEIQMDCGMPDERLFEVVFEGKEFTDRVSRTDGKVPAAALDLYNSIKSGDTIRMMMAVGETRFAPLDVALAYQIT